MLREVGGGDKVSYIIIIIIILYNINALFKVGYVF